MVFVFVVVVLVYWWCFVVGLVVGLVFVLFDYLIAFCCDFVWFVLCVGVVVNNVE